MVKLALEVAMSIDILYAKAVERKAKESNLDMRKLAHDVMQLSTPDVSIREFRRCITPDTKGRFRHLTLREAFDFARRLLTTVDDLIADGVLHNDKD